MKKIAAFLLVVLLVVGIAPTAYAASEIKDIDAFSGIEGINKSDNYFLDTADLTIFDAVITAYHLASNILFGVTVKTVKLTCAVYYHTTSVNLAYIFDSQISGIQRDLKNNFFNAIIPLSISLMGFSIAGYMLKRNFQGVIGQFVKFFVVFASVGILATHSITIIGLIDTVTTTMSSAVMSAVSGQNSGENYSVITSKELWRALVHEPWKALEFGDYKPDQKIIDDLLSGNYKPLSDERKEYIDAIYENEEDSKPFNKSMPLSRLNSLIVHGQFTTIQCLIYVAYGMLIFTFRFMTVLLMIMGTLFMVVSLFPTSKGYTLIKEWARKIVDLQLNILVINFIVSFTLIANNMLYPKINEWGFLVVEVIQAVFALIVFLFRTQIINMFTTASNSAQGQVKKATSQIHHALAIAGVTGGAMHYRNIIAGYAGSRAQESASASYNNSGASASNSSSSYSGAGGAEPSTNKSAEQEQAARPVLVDNQQAPVTESGSRNSEVTDALRRQNTTQQEGAEPKQAAETERPVLVNDFHRNTSALDDNSVQNAAHLGSINPHTQPAPVTPESPSLGEYQPSGASRPRLEDPPKEKTKQTGGSDRKKSAKNQNPEQTDKRVKKQIEGQPVPSNSTGASNIPVANGTRRENTRTKQGPKTQGPVLVD